MSGADLLDPATRKPIRASSPEEAEALYRSGKAVFAKNAQVPVVNQAGEVGTLAETDLPGAMAKGVRLASPDQVAQARAEARHAEDKERYGGKGVVGKHVEDLTAQGAAVARGASFGLSDEIASDLGYVFGGEKGRKEVTGRLRYAKEEHPIQSGIGEVEGMLLPSLIPGGGAAGAVARAPGAAAHAVEGAALRALTREGAGAAERAIVKGLGSAAGAATEGAIRGAGEVVSEHALGDDPELTSEKILAGATHGAVSWGLAGGLLGGVGAGLGEARDAAGRYLQRLRPADVDALAQKQFGYVPKGLGDIWGKAADASAALSGGDVNTIRKLSDLSAEGAEARRLAVFDAPVVREQASREVRSQLDSLLESSQEITQEAKGRLKASYVESAVKKGNEAQTLEFAQRYASDLRVHVEDMLSNPKEYGLIGSLKGMREWLDALDTTIARIERGEPATIGSEADALDLATSSARRKGVVNSDYLREGMRDMSHHRGAYEGASADEANLIATGQAPARNSGKTFEPIKVGVHDGQVELIDGRHRLMAAQEAGATEIRAMLRTEYKGQPVTREVILPIQAVETPMAASGRSANAQLFTAIDDTKRAFGRWTKAAQAVEKKSDPLALMRGRATRDRLQGIYEDMRQGLENEELWGKAAEDQAKINAAWSKQIDAQRVFDSKLTTNVGRDPKNPWVDIRRVDPAKADAYVGGLTNPNNDLVHSAIRKYVESTRELSEAIGRSWELPAEKAAHVARVGEAAKAFDGTLSKAENALTLANQFQALKSAESGSAADMVTGAIFGGGLGGPIGGILGAAAGAMAKPANTIARLAALERLMNKVDLRIGSSIRGFFRNVGRKTEPASLRLGSRWDMATGTAEERGAKGDAFLKSVAMITELATTPEASTRRVADSLAGLEQAAPQTSAALSAQTMRVTTFLAGKIPPGMSDPYALNGRNARPMVSESEKARFLRYVAAANDPTTVLEDMQHGRLSPEAVEALRACYPKLYDQVRGQIIDHLVTQQSELPYGKRVQLGVLFDAPTDATLDPDFLRAIAGPQASARAEAEGAPMKGGPPARELRVADSFKTTFEAVRGERE